MKLQISRPLIFFDIETTGTDILNDRVVEISVLKVLPNGNTDSRTRRINPGMPIPPAATAVHGISDADVEGHPRFAELARSMSEFFADADLAGYNSNGFDVPFLVEEFARAGIEFPAEGTRLIDVCTIFKRKEERTLSAAYKFYCDKDLTDAHSAEADVRATYEVLLGQMDRYPDIGAFSVDDLHRYCSSDRLVDHARKLTRNEQGVIVFNFGQHRGEPVLDFPDYVRWMLQSDFPLGTKLVLRRLIHTVEQPG